MKLTLTSALTTHRAREKAIETLSRDRLLRILHRHRNGLQTDLISTMDYAIWGKLQVRVYCTRIRDVDQLVERLMEEWPICNQEIISSAELLSGELVCVRL